MFVVINCVCDFFGSKLVCFGDFCRVYICLWGLNVVKCCFFLCVFVGWVFVVYVGSVWCCWEDRGYCCWFIL